MLYITSERYWEEEEALNDEEEWAGNLPEGCISHCENSFLVDPRIYPGTEEGIRQLKNALLRINGFIFNEEFMDFVQE